MKLSHVAVAALALGVATAALAESKAESAIQYRQALMTVNIHALGPLIGMAQGKIPYDKAVVAKNSQILEALIGLPWASFGPGTEKGAPTKADMKIWSEQAKFKEASDQTEQAVAKLGQAVKGGDEKAVKTAIGEVGKACNSCHHDYRLKRDRS